MISPPVPQPFFTPDAPPETAERPRATATEAPAEHVAVLVCHGMGQQVRFGTLDDLARAVFATAVRCKTALDPDISVALQPDAGNFHARAELNLKKSDGSRASVHFYEAYWAPLTEGRVTLRETLRFFVDAGLGGLRFAWRDGVFNRSMFGGRQEFEIPARRIWQLGLALWVLLLVSTAFAAVTVLPLFITADRLRAAGADREIAGAATVALSIGVVILVSFLIAMIAARAAGVGADTGRPKSATDAQPGMMASKSWRRWGSAALTVIAAIASIVITAVAGYLMYRCWLLPAAEDPVKNWPRAVLAVILLGGEAFAFLRVMRGFLIEFGGDVAAYVAPFKVSKFEEIRRAIQERGRSAARFIYAVRAPGSDRPLYDRVMVVGHSLGSVLAYDTLNDAMNRDASPEGWGAGSRAHQYDVVNRTRLLLTFGSPLDKTAFIFRTQRNALEVTAREKLASAVQPLIQNYDNRRCRWVNVWSRSDWISGPLGYYDQPQPPPGQGVCNIENRGSRNPGTAHTEYWEGPLISGVLHHALIGTCPPDVPEPQRSRIVAALA
ncbi:MAG: hypothetical protein NUW01_12845 [Gemmatimonadaceae bacterium]|nr:hypothetical protein [Gemmatimonadaceae bacterium]